ncbi:MAG: xylulose kinase [Candidatus Hydrogenedentota bacterium]|nr:MAG: xylulose kinase [Candidatus Hydrogenedentota bacterium]
MRKNSAVVLAIDHGTSGMKTALVNLHGEVIQTASYPTKLIFTSDGGVEQSGTNWIQAVEKSIALLYHNKQEYRKKTIALCISSTFSTTVAVDKQGNALSILTWLDARAAKGIRKKFGGKFLGYSFFKILPFLYYTGGGPTLSGKDDLAHILFWKDEKPEIYEKAQFFLPSKDYLNFVLTGNVFATYDSMALFWLTNNRNPNSIQYQNRLLKLSSIEKEKLPPLVSSTYCIGKLLPKWQKKWNLPPLPIFAGSADLPAACIGSGCTENFQPHLYVGTSSWILAHTPWRKTDPAHAIACLPAAIEGKYYAANEQDMAGGALEKVCSWLFSETERKQKNFFQKLEKEASNVAPSKNNLLFIPWLNGEKTPLDNENVRGSFLGLHVQHSKAHLIRAVYEGIALNSKWLLFYLEKFLKRNFSTLPFIGGGATSSLWCQIYADVLQKEIRPLQNPQAANARGAAILALVGLGEGDFSYFSAKTKFTKSYQPNKELADLYEKKLFVLKKYAKNKSLNQLFF